MPENEQPARGEPSASTKHCGWIPLHWRPVLLLIILGISATAGLHYKSRANPGVEPSSFRSQPPQYINVYVSNARVLVNLSVDLYKQPPWQQSADHPYKGFLEQVTVSVTSPHPSPETVAITSSTPPQGDPDNPSKPIAVKNGSTVMKYAYLDELDNSNRFSATEDFSPGRITMESNGSTFGRLPAVGLYDFAEGGGVGLVTEYLKTGNIKDLVFNASRISSYGQRGLFWLPQGNISYTEDLQDVMSSLAADEMDYMTPAAASLNTYNGQYVWRQRSCCGLKPIFKATNPNAVDAQNKAAFISGIAFGVAGAAAIAIVQELPKEPPFLERRSRKRRKHKPAQSSVIRPGTEK